MIGLAGLPISEGGYHSNGYAKPAELFKIEHKG
jgi:hypothetical protein